MSATHSSQEESTFHHGKLYSLSHYIEVTMTATRRAALAILCLWAAASVCAQTGPTPEALALTPGGRDLFIPVQQTRELTFRAPTEWPGSPGVARPATGREPRA